MRTQTRFFTRSALVLVGALAIGAAVPDTAEAAGKRRHHHVAKPSLVVDDWGRCWLPRKNGWWLTRCPGQLGAVMEGGVPLRMWPFWS